MKILRYIDCSIGEGKRDCHSGESCSGNNDCIFKNCENFVCVRKLANGCKVGGKAKNCKLNDPCRSSDDCQTPGCAENDNGETVCVWISSYNLLENFLKDSNNKLNVVLLQNTVFHN